MSLFTSFIDISLGITLEVGKIFQEELHVITIFSVMLCVSLEEKLQVLVQFLSWLLNVEKPYVYSMDDEILWKNETSMSNLENTLSFIMLFINWV